MPPQTPPPRGSPVPGRPAWAPRSSSKASSTTRHQGMSSSFSNFIFFVLLCFAGSSLAQRDPVSNFCRRFGHQTAVIDRKIYIDGGFINYSPLPSNPTNYTNTFLSYQDLDHVGSAGMPQLYANLSKNATIPSVNGGSLWADNVNKKIYLFGGEYYQAPPADLTLYSYDVLNDYWQTVAGLPKSISSVSYGAGVSISEKGEAYYYGGWLSNNSVPGWSGPRTATSGIIKYSMDTNAWSNMTGPSDNIPRAEGVMVYIPVSDGGMLVYFGGIQSLSNGTVIGQPMDQIFIFDLASSRWYQQTATGEVPATRARFCAGATWAPDKSSYNVYLYGGAGIAPNTSGFDDVYVLSIPSFTWIKMYPTSGNNTEQYPHNMLSCNVIDGAQMIIIGGSFPLDTTTCDAPDQYGSHGLDMAEQNPDGSPWALYRQNITSYVVPTLISDVIGGGAQGAATKTVPDGGFNANDLKILMTRKYTAPVRSPTRDVSGPQPPAPALSTGAIVGIAVGGGIVLIGLLCGCYFCIRRRRRQRQSAKPSSTGPLDLHSQSGDMGTPWSQHSSRYTPTTPYPHSPFLRRPRPDAVAVIPQHPIEMPDSHGATNGTYNGEPFSAAGTGVGVAVSPYSTEPKYDYSWSPTREDITASVPNVVYAGGGFGPRELDTGTVRRDGPRDGDVSPRHETYYHS